MKIKINKKTCKKGGFIYKKTPEYKIKHRYSNKKLSNVRQTHRIKPKLNISNI
jgi:hypothetical protein